MELSPLERPPGGLGLLEHTNMQASFLAWQFEILVGKHRIAYAYIA